MARRNLSKVVSGGLIGAGIGAAVSVFVRRANEPPEERQPVSDSVRGWRERRRQSWNDYWGYLQEAGEQARLAKEEEMRDRFREKVNDQSAFTSVEDLSATEDVSAGSS